MEYQLRRYRIQPGKLRECIAAWRAGVYPLRVKHGFRILGAWTIEESNEFVWILGYEGPDGFAAADAAYYASAERAALEPDPARYFERTEQWFMASVL
jgi:hypothetical protein